MRQVLSVIAVSITTLIFFAGVIAIGIYMIDCYTADSQIEVIHE